MQIFISNEKENMPGKIIFSSIKLVLKINEDEKVVEENDDSSSLW